MLLMTGPSHAFQIQPLREFLVADRALPPALARMSQLAYNVFWSWEPTIGSCSGAWIRRCGGRAITDPVSFLGRIPQASLEKLAGDPRLSGPVSPGV